MSLPEVLHRRALAALALVALLAAGACAADDSPADADLVRVPQDAATISEAVAAVAEGGLVLVGPGHYAEQVLIETPGITLRGLDRNETVIDGGGVRPYAVVTIADGVSIENLTVTGATFYGVLVTGLHDENGPTAHDADGYALFDPEQFPPVQGFAIDHVTAHNNGLYGLYAFNAQHGVIRDSYASGSADSGIYIGQCRECDILVTGNVAEANAVGFENANASDSVYVVGNRFSGNRVGMTFLSNYQEAFVPQRGNTVVGNLVANNTWPDSPAHAEGGFGIGIGISGGTENLFERNLIAGNLRAGLLLEGTEDLPAIGNVFQENTFSGNGVDAANVSGPRAPARGNCVAEELTPVLPDGLFAECPLTGEAADSAEQPAVAATDLPEIDVPAGVSFLQVAPPPAQPGIDDVEAPARVLPEVVGEPDLAAVMLPEADLFADRSRS